MEDSTLRQGTYVALSAGLMIPAQGGRVDGAAFGELGYQFQLARVSLDASVRLGSYLPSTDQLGVALASARVLYPLEIVTPFLFAGVGPGYLSSRARAELAYQVGGGALIGITRTASIGAELTYTQLGDSDFHRLFLGPVLRAMLD